VLDETTHAKMIVAIDAAISRCIDAFNIASEAGDTELAEGARARVNGLKAYRQEIASRPTRPSRWMQARSPRGDARPR
jgi:hypothetical protein